MIENAPDPIAKHRDNIALVCRLLWAKDIPPSDYVLMVDIVQCLSYDSAMIRRATEAIASLARRRGLRP